MQTIWNHFYRLIASSGELMSLQLSVIKSDVNEWKQEIRIGFLVIAAAAFLGVSSLPLLLYALAAGLVAILEVHFLGTLAIVAGICLMTAGLLAVYGLHRVSQSWHHFKRSQYELSQNVRWLQGQIETPNQKSSSTMGENL